MSECTVMTLNEKVGAGEGTLVDVREYAEFAGSRVSAARLIPLGEIENRHVELDRGDTIYVMCRTGRRSREAQTKLRNLGFSSVVNVQGGIEAWKNAELPLVEDENAPWALDRQVRFVAGSLVVAGVLLALFVHIYFLALSAFVGAGLVFSAVTDTCTMGLVLSRMPWNRIPESGRPELKADDQAAR